MKRLGTSENVSSIAEGMLGGLDRTGEGRERARVVSAWRIVAGAEVFAHARGFVLRDGELVIFVDSPVWANELSMLAEHYRLAVNERVGKEAVGSMRFAVSRRVAEELDQDRLDEASVAEKERDKVEPIPATAVEREQVRQLAASIKNAELREAVIAAAMAHLQWRKGIEARNEAERASQRAREPFREPQR